ncbi:hypothetical protein JF544_18140 [Halobacillus kuroshimensis]|uniref:Uncharacterized protein n=1 Tax=Halobacillus kuroshimensis TaxID=302481 RepID=A0ABS3E0N7_9BACI|nr:MULTISPECIES: hypothetical protein [Halobacillus]MBN8237170.1 hypothetical protein [Halobacillus kuroshimensis]
MIQVIVILVSGFGLYMLFNWLMGYRKGHIQMDLDQRYFDFGPYVKAVLAELKDRGYEASYEGNGIFSINGRRYVFMERNVSMGGAPLQRTILKPDK